MATAVLAVDAGQSGCRLRLSDRGKTTETVETTGLPPGDRPEVALVRVIGEAVRRLADASTSGRGIDTVAVGLTALNGNRADAELLLREFRRLVDVRRVVVADDAVTSYLGAVGWQPGVVVAAGTGAVAFGCDAQANSARVDGWSHEFGDAGSGYAIGRAAIRAAFCEFDGRGGSRVLMEAAVRRFGPLPDLPATLSAAPDRVRQVAGFARDVAVAAEAGDEVARQIWRDAGGRLAESAIAAARRAGVDGEDCVVVCTGALAGAGPLLLDPFGTAVRAALPKARLSPPRGTALDGSAALATLPETAALAAFVTRAAM
jgi:N-acetylglucosamine kinase-like BadF-type ATPase